MKTLHLSFIAVCLQALCFGSAVKADEKTWVDLTFDSVEPGNPPATAPFNQSSVNHFLESVSVTESNTLQVVKDIPGFQGKALRLIKGSSEPRTPRAIFVNIPGLVKSGKIRFTWEASIGSFEASDKFPGFEALLTFVLVDSPGKPFFNFYYLVNASRSGGFFGIGGQKLGSWTVGTKQQFELLVDLDAGTALIKVDGAPLGPEQKFAATDGLRVVQFGDGTGLACYGSKFTATLANFKMSSL